VTVTKKVVTQFLIKARTKTYAGSGGEVEPLLVGSKQLEYKEKDLLYRDIYNQGNGKFVGLETVYYNAKPIWSMSYYGNFEKMTEDEADNILRKALLDKKDKVRLWNNVTYDIDEFTYSNQGSGNISELDGSESITKSKQTVYFFYYAGGFIGK